MKAHPLQASVLEEEGQKNRDETWVTARYFRRRSFFPRDKATLSNHVHGEFQPPAGTAVPQDFTLQSPWKQGGSEALLAASDAEWLYCLLFWPTPKTQVAFFLHVSSWKQSPTLLQCFLLPPWGMAEEQQADRLALKALGLTPSLEKYLEVMRDSL